MTQSYSASLDLKLRSSFYVKILNFSAIICEYIFVLVEAQFNLAVSVRCNWKIWWL